MKSFKLLVLGMFLFFAGSLQAQFSVRFNIGVAPEWAPVEQVQVRYYYLPDVEAYYDVSSSMFIYLDGRNWVHRTYLPYRYRNYNLYSGYKVSMNNYHGHTPYTQFYEQKSRYSRGRNREYQQTIGQRPQKGNYSSQQYRENNQANRGRYETAEKYDNRNSHNNNYDNRYNNNGDKRDNNKNNNHNYNDNKNNNRGNQKHDN